MAGNSFGTLFRFTTFGESHGPQIGCVVDGVPAGLSLSEADIQPDLDRRKPGTSKYVTQRREGDEVSIVSGVFEGRTTGSPIGLIIHNGDQRSKDYGEIRDQFRPGHADFTYWQKYGLRDYRGGGRSSARETAMRVAAGAIARVILRELPPAPIIVRGALVAMGGHGLDRGAWDWDQVAENAFFCPDAKAATAWAEALDQLRKDGNSAGGVIEPAARNASSASSRRSTGSVTRSRPSAKVGMRSPPPARNELVDTRYSASGSSGVPPTSTRISAGGSPARRWTTSPL